MIAAARTPPTPKACAGDTSAKSGFFTGTGAGLAAILAISCVRSCTFFGESDEASLATTRVRSTRARRCTGLAVRGVVVMVASMS